MIEPAILHYCQYQERCHKEVRNKLYELGFTTDTVNFQISALIEGGILNEERFAAAYARGKFRILHWGKGKIKQQLVSRGVSEYCIRRAMKEIDANEYGSVLAKLALKKWDSLKKDKNVLVKKGKVSQFLVQKGYERDLVAEVVCQISTAQA